MWVASLSVTALLFGANPHLDEARRHFDAMRYDRAEARLRLAREVPTTPEERRELFDLLARALAAQGHMDEAQRTYEELLAEDPGAPAPTNASPKIRDAFRRAKERLYPPGFVALKELPAPPGYFDVQVIDPWGTVRRLVLIEPGASGSLVERPIPWRSGPARAPLRHGREARFHVEARGADGQVIARLGSAEAPLVRTGEHVPVAKDALDPRFLPTAPAPPLAPMVLPDPTLVPEAHSIRPTRVAGSVLGAVSIAAAVVGTGLALSASEDSAAAGRATYASDIRLLDLRARDKAIWANALLGGAAIGGAGAVVLMVAW